MAKEQKNVLIVDDEPKILDVVASAMESQSFTVFKAETGRRALEIFDKETISLVLLDLMLPDISGEEVCSRIRGKSRVPIIMLTAKVEEENILEGLGLGADDYLAKPFSLKVLRARVEALLRRSAEEPVPLFHKAIFGGGDLEIDFTGHSVIQKGMAVKLTPSEYQILSVLARYPNKVFTREELIQTVFGADFEGYDRAVDSHVKNLRQKIEANQKEPVYVVTIRGVGYKFGGEP